MDYHTYYAGENGVLVHNMCNTAKNTATEATENLADEVNKGGGDTAKIDFYVTPAGDAIPANKVQFENNLSMMDNVNGKYLGETTNGPVRVRIEGPHPLDENFNGDWDSDHFIDHIHIEHRKNGNSGPWGKVGITKQQYLIIGSMEMIKHV